MNITSPKTLLALLSIGLLAVTGVGISQAGEAKSGQAKNLLLFSQAKISLTEAIKIAEQKTGGKAMEAELDDEAKTVQFEVEIVKAGVVHEVIVDGKSGQVLKVALNDEADEKGEKADGHEKE